MDKRNTKRQGLHIFAMGGKNPTAIAHYAGVADRLSGWAPMSFAEYDMETGGRYTNEYGTYTAAF